MPSILQFRELSRGFNLRLGARVRAWAGVYDWVERLGIKVGVKVLAVLH